MIVGLFLRYIKNYQSINYIPLSNGMNFSGVIGPNGAGKSTLLEAMDVFFNGGNKEGIANNEYVANRGKPTIAPVFLFTKEEIMEMLSYKDEAAFEANSESIKSHSDSIKNIFHIDIESVSPSQVKYFKSLKSHLTFLDRNGLLENNFLIVIGCFIDNRSSSEICIFKNNGFSDKIDENMKNLFNAIKNNYSYIYIPREVNINSFNNLSSERLYDLLGDSLPSYISKAVGTTKLAEINSQLKKLMDKINSIIPGYTFKGRHSSERESYLRRPALHNLLIKEFFSSKLLHYSNNDASLLPMELMSSGERQKAIVDIMYDFLTFDEQKVNSIGLKRKSSEEIMLHKADAKNMIIAIDEPDSSLHISACFEQFSKIKNMSDVCSQVIFTSHWYGYMPYLQDGSTSFIGAIINEEEKYNASIILDNFSPTDSIKNYTSLYKGVKLPVPVSVKGVSDLAQSIIHGAGGELGCNWIICEGTSDKIYLDHYFKEEIGGEKMRVIPVGGVVNLKKIYLIMTSFFNDFEDSIKGKIVFISDTDAQLVSSDGITLPGGFRKKVEWVRLMVVDNQNYASIFDVREVKRCNVTTIEDSLNGKVFHQALLSFADEFCNDLKEHLLSLSDISEGVPNYAMELPPHLSSQLKMFFDDKINGHKRKFKVASEYVRIAAIDNTSYKIPHWITQLKEMF